MFSFINANFIFILEVEEKLKDFKFYNNLMDEKDPDLRIHDVKSPKSQISQTSVSMSNKQSETKIIETHNKEECMSFILFVRYKMLIFIHINSFKCKKYR